MKRLVGLIAVVAALVFAIPAQASITYWSRGTSNYVSNHETNTVLVTSFDCGQVVAVDNDPNTSTQRTLYLDIPDSDQTVGWQVSLKEFDPDPWQFGGLYGAGGFQSDGLTTLWLPFNGYPEENTLGVRHAMVIGGSTNRLMKVRADGPLPWLVRRLCPPPS